MILSYRGIFMYKTKHNYNDKISDYLEKLYFDSYTHYIKITDNINSSISNYNIDITYNIIENVDNYIFSLVRLGYIDNDNLEDFLRGIDGIKSILPIYLDSYSEGKITGSRIFVNTNSNNSNLDSSEVLRLRTFYMVTSFIHKFYRRNTDRTFSLLVGYLNNLDDSLDLSQERKNFYTYNGFSCLDSVLSEDISLDVNCFIKGQDRDKLHIDSNPLIFDGESYSTNFNKYGEIQDIFLLFSKSVVDSSLDSLFLLSKMSLSKDFIYNLYCEFLRYGLVREFVHILMYFGIFKDSLDFLYGDNNIYPSLEMSSKSKKLFKDLNRKIEVVKE